MRVHRNGSLGALTRRYDHFLNRLRGGWTPVTPFAAFDQVQYHRDSDPVPRPYSVFKLFDYNDDTVSYPHAKLIHLAGMVRHAAIELMTRNPPSDLRGRTAQRWIEQYVAGHQPPDGKSADMPHAQFSYIPLPSIGHPHADPAIRRVMIVAPLGDEVWLDHLSPYLDGQELAPLPGTKLPPATRLERIPDRRRDGVREKYTCGSRSWASFTPVILPGTS